MPDHTDTEDESVAELAGVLFDMDGTLFDSEKLWDVSLDELAASLGGTLSKRTRQALVGSNLYESVSLVHEDLGIDADPVRSGEFLLRRTKELFAIGLPWKPGAQRLLAEVKASGLPMGLVTSTHRDLTDVALRNFPDGMFGVVVCGDEVERTKPDPESYVTAAARLGIDPHDCVGIEDSPRGIASAEAAGCSVVAVPSEVPVPQAPGRIVVDSLEKVTVEWLYTVPEQIRSRSAAAS